MKKYLFLLLLLPCSVRAENTEQPPFENRDPAISSNFREIYYSVDKLSLLTSLFTYTFDSSNNLFCIDSPTFCVDEVNHTVGIGTTTAATLLHIVGISSVNNGNTKSRLESVLTGRIASVELKNSSGVVHAIGIETDTDAGGGAFAGAASSFNIELGSSKDMTIGINGTTKLWNLTSAGERTQPLQPSFLVTNSGVTDVTGDGTVYNVGWNAEVYDQGADFTASTFTAPVDGRYLFTLVLTIRGALVTHTNRYADVLTSNRAYGTQFTRLIAEDYDVLLVHVIADMDANDTARVRLEVDASTKVIDLAADATLNYFSGSLIN